MREVTIVGAGPAGACAALAALRQGARVLLYDKSHFPRHKVCGEFLSSGFEPVLRDLGVWDAFVDAAPARITHAELHLGNQTLSSRLPSPAAGLSRFRFDQLLLNAARDQGAEFRQAAGPESASRPVVLARGRYAIAPAKQKGARLFGFKAHYWGPVRDAVELYFFNGCYVGISCVENGITNVCGLGPEHQLRRVGFHIDELLGANEPLRERLAPLTRSMAWLTVGPLLFRNRLRSAGEEGVYLAGDALSFVDPFTGSGMLSAVLTGRLAGQAAVRELPVSDYLAQCRRTLATPFLWASLLRQIASQPWAAALASVVPTALLYRLTRPHHC